MPADRSITEAAQKRLQVLVDLDSLGAGFQLASHDLDIRGAGNLLGDEQSGHIKEVGFELYQSMLEDAIIEMKAGGVPRRGGVHAADQRRCADHDPRTLCARSRPPDGPLPPPGRARGPPGDRRLRRRDDRPLRSAPRRDRKPAEDRRGQVALPAGEHRQARPRPARRGGDVRRRPASPTFPGCSATSSA